MNVSTSAPSPDTIMLRKMMLARSLASRPAPWFSYPYPGSTLSSLAPPRPIMPTPLPGFPSSNGLDLLRAVSMRVPNTVSGALPPAVSAVSSPVQGPKACPRLAPKSDTDEKYYIDEIRDIDVLCGRGGKSNHHAGNKKYRLVVSEMKNMYRSTEAKKGKTGLSRAIVDHVCEYGGRFVKKDGSGRYYVLSKAEARKKTSQALRETKTLKWTN